MLDVRLRLPELLTERGHTTWTIAQASNGKLSYNTLYRVAKNRGRMKLFDAALCQALVDTLKLDTMDDLFESERSKRSR